MNFKIAIVGGALMAFAGIFSVTGCGGDDCTKAADHLVSCLGASSTASTSSSTTVACTGAALCNAGCYNAADCPAIKDALSGMPTSASKTLLDCVTKCATAK
jgi:hypothetical protein